MRLGGPGSWAEAGPHGARGLGFTLRAEGWRPQVSGRVRHDLVEARSRQSAERKQGARVGGSCDGWRRTGGPARDVSGQPRRTANGVSPAGVAPRGRHRGSRERPEPVPGVGLEHPRGDGGLPVEQRFWGVRRASSGVYSRQL